MRAVMTFFCEGLFFEESFISSTVAEAIEFELSEGLSFQWLDLFFFVTQIILKTISVRVIC